MLSTYHQLCYILAALFLWAGWLNLFGPGFIAEEFRQWKYPDWFRVAVGIVEWSIVVMLIAQLVPRGALLLAGALLLGVVFTFVKHRQFMRLEMPVLLMSLVAILLPLTPPLGILGI